MKTARRLLAGFVVVAALFALNRCGTKETAVFGETTFFPNFTTDAAK